MRFTMPKVIMFFLSIASFSISVISAEEQTGSVETSKISINGIHINTRERNIYKLLGKPDKTIDHGVDIVTNAIAKTIYYSGLEIYLIHGEIYKLRCKGDLCLTGAGIRIGHNTKAVLRAYGSPKYKSKNNFSYVLLNNDKHTNSTLSFKFRDNKIMEILYLVDYT